ncbi:MAG: NAD(P)H-dependent oxidoreductase [bacterium]|nr:NAD(P)H-dependent oxidoreductase [bacterium]
MVLYINSCVREDSRTDTIARAVLQKIGEEYQELYLPGENLQPLSRETLNKRSALVQQGDYSDPLFNYAKQFATADVIVIAAPYWDLSFPALLKIYIENIYAVGLVTEFNANGQPRGLCHAKRLIYVTTAGGPYLTDYGFGYIKALAEQHFGIPQTVLVKAEMLDVEGFDAAKIVATAIDNIKNNPDL